MSQPHQGAANLLNELTAMQQILELQRDFQVEVAAVQHDRNVNGTLSAGSPLLPNCF